MGGFGGIVNMGEEYGGGEIGKNVSYDIDSIIGIVS